MFLCLKMLLDWMMIRMEMLLFFSVLCFGGKVKKERIGSKERMGSKVCGCCFEEDACDVM